MLRAFRWLALAGVVTTAALVGPAAAFACDGSGSAASIYTECVPKPSGGHKPKPPTKPVHQTPPTVTPSPHVGPYVAPKPKQVRVSPRTRHTINRAGKDKRDLSNIVKNPRFANGDHLKPVLLSAPTA